MADILDFKISEYLSRIERSYLDMLENLQPIDKTITLWIGLEGLRLNEDGTTEWLSRKNPAENVFYQPCQSIQPMRTGLGFEQAQCTRAQIEALMAQNAAREMQCLGAAYSAQIANAAWLAWNGGNYASYRVPYITAGAATTFGVP